MGILSEDMKRVVEEQRLGFVATVCADGTPNLSPKGTTAVWDDDHLVFANIASPGTIENLKRNPSVEINLIDQTRRKGYRFKGTAEILDSGPLFDEIIRFYRERKIELPIQGVVLVKVERALPLISPVYDLGATEEEVQRDWETYWENLRRKRAEERAES